MPNIVESNVIAGLKTVELTEFADTRGRFVETFRKEWFPERTWDIVQANRSDSAEGVLRGLHFHHYQVDYWYPLKGRIRVGLYDLRKSSPTHGGRLVMDLSEAEPSGLFVPVGVAHGFLALEPSTLTYLVDNYYDDSDEHGVAWNDPEIGLDWGIAAPSLSDRDRKNPLLRDLPADQLPD